MIRILLIEDNLLNLELVTDLLEENGFIVFQARTGGEGVRVAQHVLPDLILMDFGLPDMHGLAATTILKSSEITGHVPVIALTAHAMKGDDRAALEAGCNGYFTKPIDTRTFVETLTQFLPNQPSKKTSSKTYAK